MNSSRRVFVIRSVATGAAIAASPLVFAQAKPQMLDEKDATAVALGYVADTAKADQKKFPKHDKAQNCGNCAIFIGKATDPAGGCPLFAGKQVATKGWCSAYAKKAA